MQHVVGDSLIWILHINCILARYFLIKRLLLSMALLAPKSSRYRRNENTYGSFRPLIDGCHATYHVASHMMYVCVILLFNNYRVSLDEFFKLTLFENPACPVWPTVWFGTIVIWFVYILILCPKVFVRQAIIASNAEPLWTGLADKLRWGWNHDDDVYSTKYTC